MVLNPDPEGFETMLDYRLEPEIFHARGLETLHGVLRNRGMSRYPVHIKFDTGMHRLGFQEADVGELVQLLNNDEFQVVSVFSHLAASDEPEHDEFTREQIKVFKRMSDRLVEGLGYPVPRHIVNSAGIERFPEAQFQMVRLGIGLHGIGTGQGLKPVSTYKTRISQLRSVQPGETVGYSRAGKIKRDSVIATIPLGYADGLDRRLGNGEGRVWINGSFAPLVGNVCMDMTMIDVTGIPVKEGDEVELFGKHLSVTEVARDAGTIPYEILTSVPERVKRVYLQE
jgi:alanine racemase